MSPYWGAANPKQLELHEPETTDVVVAHGSQTLIRKLGGVLASAAATSASRFTAGACGFLNLSQSGDRLVPATLLWLAHP